MTGIIKELKNLWSRKIFAITLSVIMLLSYCTLITHPTIGIDDTSFKLYYIDGVSPAMGRWVIYMLNKIIPLNYNPVFVESVGLIFFCISISLWTIVFRRIFEEKISDFGYTLFACTMISSPILSEVVIWYCQDCIYLGYGFTAFAVLLGMRELKVSRNRKANIVKADKKPKITLINLKTHLKSFFKQLLPLLLVAFFLSAALGCYEAFMIVFLIAWVLIFFSIRLTENKNYVSNPIIFFVKAIGITVFAMIFRSIIINAIVWFYNLEEQKLVLQSRDASDILNGVLAWFDKSGSNNISNNFSYVLKDFFVKYYCNAIVYTPIMIFVLSIIALFVIGGIWATINRKDVWMLLSVLAVMFIPLVLPIIEGHATYYRSSEYIPLVTAFALLFIMWKMRGIRTTNTRIISLVLVFILLYRQAYEMNKWLYVDSMKYENDKLIMSNLALELMRDYDCSKPICVVGNYKTPEGLIENVYVPTWSKKYDLIKLITESIEPKIFEKYNTEYGYVAAETPTLSFINWGSSAFYSTDRELIKFWKMHGFSFYEDGNIEHYAEAQNLMQDAPAWPESGSIVELEDYIIVNFGVAE